MSQKSMFDRYYCIKTVCRSKTLEKMLRKELFSCVHNGVERHVICERFENAAKSNRERERERLGACLQRMVSIVPALVKSEDVNIMVQPFVSPILLRITVQHYLVPKKIVHNFIMMLLLFSG